MFVTKSHCGRTRLDNAANCSTGREPSGCQGRYNRYDEKPFTSHSKRGRLAPEPRFRPDDIAFRGLLAMPGRTPLSAGLHDAAQRRERTGEWIHLASRV